MSKSVEVRLSADVSGFQRGMDRAAASAKGLTGALPKDTGFLGRINQHEAELNQLAGTMAKVGAVGMAAFGGVAKVAIDWESDFAGVKKTVDDTAVGYAALSNELRGLARELPASHREIAGVAEVAGQLGVAREDITAFTRTMIDLGETTNLSAAEAATGLARFSAIMGTSHSDVGRLGSTIVGLGNNFATTESEILGLSMRLAGMGRQVGMHESDVMGLAAAMSAVGIEAEAGGTAMSLSMMKINDAVLNGGRRLDDFARTAGMTAEQFSAAWRDDPAQALQAFIAGLGRIQEEGGNTSQVLRDLGIVNQRERDAMLRLSGAADMLGESLSMAAQEFAKNSALGDEAALRYETVAAKVQVAWNNIKDAAISAGEAFLPMLVRMSEGVSALAQTIGSLPPEVLSFGVGVAGLAGAALVGMAGIIKLTTSIAALHTAMGTLSAAGPGAARAISALRVGGPIIAGLTALGVAIAGIHTALAKFDDQTFDRSAENLSKGLRKIADEGGRAADSFDQIFSTYGAAEGFAATMKTVLGGGVGSMPGMTMEEWVGKAAPGHTRWQAGGRSIWQAGDDVLWGGFDSIFGTDMSVANQATKRLEEYAAAVAHLQRTGETAAASSAYRDLATVMRDQGYSARDVSALFGDYRQALRETVTEQVAAGKSGAELRDTVSTLAKDHGIAAAASAVAAGMRDSAGGMEEASLAAIAAAEANNQLMESMFGVANAYLMMSGSLMGMEAAFDAATDSVNQYGQTLDITTEAGRANQAALDQIVASTMNLADAWMEAGREHSDVIAEVERGKAQWIASAEAMGMTDAAAQAMGERMGYTVTTVQELAEALFAVPEDVEVEFTEKGGQDVQERATGITRDVGGVPEHWETEFTEEGGRKVQERATGITRDVGGVPQHWETRFTEKGASNVQGQANRSRGAVTSIPTSRTAHLYVSGTDEAVRRASAVAAAIAAVSSKTVTITTRHHTTGSFTPGGGIPRADGGIIPGWSPHPRADNIPTMLTAGEYVHPVATVDHYGPDVMEALRSRRIPREVFSAIGLADGGQVGATGGHRPIPATAWPTTAPTQPVVHVEAPSMDGATLYLHAGALIDALDRRDRSALVATRVALRGAGR